MKTLTCLLFVLLAATPLHAQVDSARIIVRWTAPVVGVRQAPIRAYLVRVVFVATPTVAIYTRTIIAPRVIDTARVPYPVALGATSAPMLAAVATQDTLNLTSTYAVSVPFTVTNRAVAPNPPPSVLIDSSLAMLTVIRIKLADALPVLPRKYALSVYAGGVRLACARSLGLADSLC